MKLTLNFERGKKREHDTPASGFRKGYWTTTKIALHLTHLLVFAVVGVVVWFCARHLYSDTMNLAIVLSALVGAVSTVLGFTTKFYVDKATADSDRLNDKEKRESNIKAAMQVSQDVSTGKLTVEGAAVYKFLMSEQQTQLILPSAEHGGMIVDQTTYMAQNPTVSETEEGNG